MPSKWIEHIKEFAKSNGMSYKDALKDPKCKSSYHDSKGKGLDKENIEMKIEEVKEVKKGRGRPKKYETKEEAKKAKSVKTMESNKRKKMSAGMINPLSDPVFAKKYAEMKAKKNNEGEGLNVGYTTENPNGLGHIYPISHETILQMLSCCPTK